MKTEQFAHKDNAEVCFFKFLIYYIIFFKKKQKTKNKKKSSVVPTDLANAQNYGSDKNDKTPAVRIYNLRKVCFIRQKKKNIVILIVCVFLKKGL